MIRKTTYPAERLNLASQGFVRVDGLSFSNGKGVEVIEPGWRSLGCYRVNEKGYLIIVTEGGEIWIAVEKSLKNKGELLTARHLFAQRESTAVPENNNLEKSESPVKKGESLMIKDIFPVREDGELSEVDDKKESEIPIKKSELLMIKTLCPDGESETVPDVDVVLLNGVEIFLRFSDPDWTPEANEKNLGNPVFK